MIPEIEILEQEIQKYAGIESVIHIECNGISSEAYLPNEWNRAYFSVSLTFILEKLIAKLIVLYNLKVTIIPVDDFIENCTPKEKAVKAVQDLRDSYIQEYLNTDL